MPLLNLNYELKKFIKQIKYYFEDIFQKKILEKNKSLKNIHDGKSCFIIGTGSTINGIDLRDLKDHYTFSGNYIYYHKQFSDLELDYFVSTPNYRLLKKIHKKITYHNSIINNENDLDIWLYEDHISKYSIDPGYYYKKINSKISSHTKLFLGASNKSFIDMNSFFEDNDSFYLKPDVQFKSVNDISYDISNRTSMYGNLVISSIAVALYMGFKEIILIGCDYTLEPTKEFHFYDELQISKEINKEIALGWIDKIAEERDITVYDIIEDKNFYKPVFIRYGINRDQHIIINNFSKSIGVKILNIVPEGFSSPVYEGISWQDINEKIK